MTRKDLRDFAAMGFMAWAIMTAFCLALRVIGPLSFGGPCAAQQPTPSRGERHREECEEYCDDADAVLIELEGNPSGSAVCHCVLYDSE